MTYTIALDTVFGQGSEDETIEQACEFLVKEVGGDLRWEIEDPHGPGGGWPIVEWSSEDRETLERLLRNHYSFDDDEIDEWLIGPRGL